MKQVDIRFLKQGLLTIDVPDDASVEQIRDIGKQRLDEATTQELCTAMYDLIPRGFNTDRFDADSFRVEAIQEDFGEITLFSTALWEEYAYGD